MREIPYWQALQEALREEMTRDERVFLIGEDIGAYGGAFGVTRGMLADFGAERVRCTPVSEAAIVGTAIGAALTGMRPIVEIMFMDFLTLAMDQLANHAAKFHYVYGPQARVPLVLRTPAGGWRSYGPTHSQSLEGWFLHVPGVRIAVPSTPADAKGLLKTAIRDNNPTLFVEHKLLYATTGAIPDGEHCLPFGAAAVRREGHRTGGVGAEITAQIAEHAYEYLDAPIRRVAAHDVPIPFSHPLEQLVLPSKESIIRTVHEIL